MPVISGFFHKKYNPKNRRALHDCADEINKLIIWSKTNGDINILHGNVATTVAHSQVAKQIVTDNYLQSLFTRTEIDFVC